MRFPMYVYGNSGCPFRQKEACLVAPKTWFLAVLFQLEICLAPRKTREYPQHKCFSFLCFKHESASLDQLQKARDAKQNGILLAVCDGFILQLADSASACFGWGATGQLPVQHGETRPRAFGQAPVQLQVDQGERD